MQIAIRVFEFKNTPGEVFGSCVTASIALKLRKIEMELPLQRSANDARCVSFYCMGEANDDLVSKLHDSG